MSDTRREERYDNVINERVAVLVDRETGEIIDDHAPIVTDFTNNTDQPIEVRTTVAPGQRIKPFRPRKQTKEDFTMVFHASTRDLVSRGVIDDNQKSLLFSLLIYADYSQYVKGDDAMYFDVGRVASLMMWSRQKAGRTLNSLVKIQLLACTKIGHQQYYMLNPNFFYRGSAEDQPKMRKLFDQASQDNAFFFPSSESSNSDQNTSVTLV